MGIGQWEIFDRRDRASQQRRPSSNIRPSRARSRKVRKLRQNLVTSSAESGTMARRGCLQAQTQGYGAARPAIAERRSGRVGALEVGLAGGNLLSIKEAI